MKRFLSIGGLAAFLLALAPVAKADLVLDLTPGGTTNVCGSSSCTSGATFGWSFTVTGAVTVTGLGLWDAGSDGLGIDTPVGLWTSGGTLLASTVVTDASTPVGSANTAGRWLTNSVAPVTLSTGSYAIGALFFTAFPSAQTNSPFVTIPQVSGVSGAKGSNNGGFQFPGGPFGFPIFGPTMLTGAAATPEPGTFAMLATGTLLAGLYARRRRVSAR